MKIIAETSPEETQAILDSFESQVLETEIKDASDIETIVANIFKALIINASGSLAEMIISCLREIIESNEIYKSLATKFDLSQVWEFEIQESEEEYENRILDE